MTGRTARTPRTLVGLVAALGLLAALSMPALAAPHEGNPGGNCDATATSVKTDTNDGTIVLDAGTIFCAKASTTNTGTLTADGETTLNEYLIQEGIDHNVSNYVIYGMATPTPTPSESEAAATPSPTPSESGAAATPTPTPSESEAAATPREDTLGGNPTPGAGNLPDTSTLMPSAQPLAVILAMLALFSLSALVYARLAVARTRR